ncbi:hypothetical protein [Flavobacterium sp. WC2509]|uniref:hypothetical protein n=1 Tax=Flavobacterium sp. WC2509 TaxID=3461406 RepID=UPI0040446290
MERKYKITIPEPCHEDWNKMTPKDNGKFCGNCSKNVVDFTNMFPDEIQSYFQQHNNICGRFKNSQLDSLTIQIPNRVLYSQRHYHKMFLLALFIAMGTTLFSCSDKNGNKQKIDKIEVVEDTSEIKNITVGAPLPPKQNSKNTLLSPPPSSKANQVKFVKPKTISSGETIKQNNIVYEDNTTFGIIGISAYPEYAGGEILFQKYIKKNFKFTKESKLLNDILIATFIIEKDGKLDSINVSKDLGYGTKEELVRVLSNTKKWYPGEVNGKKRNCKFQLSLTIKPDTIKKSFFSTKITSKIDTIKLERITKFEND